MNIRQWLLVALVGLPIVELYFLIKLFGALGFILTLALLLGAAGLGASLLRTQGLSTWLRVQQAVARGELPAQEMLESGLIAVGGVLLILPGFVSDILALLCLIPATRKPLALYLAQRLVLLQAGSPRSAEPEGQRVIEGEFRREE